MKKNWKEKTKKEKIRTVLTICQRICAGVAAGIIILCFAFVGFKRCTNNKSMIKLAYAEETSTYAMNTSTENYFINLWQEKTTTFQPNCKPGWAILNGLPEIITNTAQIFPSNSLPETMVNGMYYRINETIENPLSIENCGYNLLCIGTSNTLMDSSTTFIVIAIIDTYEDNTQKTTWYAFNAFSRTSNNNNYPNTANGYKWTETGSTDETTLQAKYSGGFAGVTASQNLTNATFNIGTSIGTGIFSYIKLATPANLKTRQILAQYRLDYQIRFFDYSNYSGDNATINLTNLIEENATNNFYGLSSVYNGAGGGGTSGVTQEEYNQLNQKYNTALTENSLLQNQLSAAQSNYNNLLYSVIPNLKNQIQNLEQQINVLNTTNETLNSDIETLENEKADLQIQLSNKETELQEKETLIGQLDVIITNLNKTIDGLEESLTGDQKESYNAGYQAGVNATKAINKALNFIPLWAVNIWNGAISPILMFDIYGFQIGEILIGLTTILVALTITVNALKG